MRTYHGPCGHVVEDPETTTMDDGDTLLFRCPTCAVWMEPVRRSFVVHMRVTLAPTAAALAKEDAPDA